MFPKTCSKHNIRRTVLGTCVVLAADGGASGGARPDKVTITLCRRRGCWRALSSRKVAAFAFPEASGPTSVTAPLDLEYLFKCSGKPDAEATQIKICVAYRRGATRKARVSLEELLESLLDGGRPGSFYLYIYEDKVGLQQASQQFQALPTTWPLEQKPDKGKKAILTVAQIFISRLAGPSDRQLEDLRRSHGVSIVRVKRTLHIKGDRDAVLRCHRHIRDEIAEWRSAHETSPSSASSSRVIASKSAHGSSPSSDESSRVVTSKSANGTSASSDESSRVIASKSAHGSSPSSDESSRVVTSKTAHGLSPSSDESSRVVTSKIANGTSASSDESSRVVTSRTAHGLSPSSDESSRVVTSKSAHGSSASSVMAVTNSADAHGSSASTDQSSRVIASKAAHESSASTIAAEVTKSGAAHESSASTDQSSRVIASKAAHESSASTIAAEVTKSGAAHESSASTDQSSRVIASKAAHESSASTDQSSRVIASKAAHESSASTDQSSRVIASKAAHESSASTDQSSRVIASKAAHESSASTDQSSWVVTSKAAHASASSVLATPSVAARGAGLTARTGSPHRLPLHRRLVKADPSSQKREKWRPLMLSSSQASGMEEVKTGFLSEAHCTLTAALPSFLHSFAKGTRSSPSAWQP
ncbi:mucin-20-like [Eriocheir sinensis]|uniref:mucin-20-like n=1 Tax=Eriocheir sinensis TaxID=95602 RepID=UPI0021CA735A|nr:mucin-20-like [Eriocheir sinensis]